MNNFQSIRYSGDDPSIFGLTEEEFRPDKSERFRKNLLANSLRITDAMFPEIHEMIEKVLKNVGLYEFIKTLPKGVFTDVGEKGVNLSGGQLQRVGLARAFYREPEILILDESTSALDPFTEKVILDSIYKMNEKLTVIFISHKQSNLDKCDVIFKIENNKIFKI